MPGARYASFQHFQRTPERDAKRTFPAGGCNRTASSPPKGPKHAEIVSKVTYNDVLHPPRRARRFAPPYHILAWRSPAFKACLAIREKRFPNLFWDPCPIWLDDRGRRTMGMNGGSSVSYLALTPCVPLFYSSFNRGGNKRAFRLQGGVGIISIVQWWNLLPRHIWCRWEFPGIFLEDRAHALRGRTLEGVFPPSKCLLESPFLRTPSKNPSQNPFSL